MNPRLAEGLFVHHQDGRILYFNPIPPDWITINERYQQIFECFDGNHSEEDIETVLLSRYADESSILIPQIKDLINTSKIFSHNLGENDVQRDVEESSDEFPKYIYLTLTDQCNLRCQYCYATERRKSRDVGFDTWSKYIESILDTCNAPVFIFTGGEPLLVPYVFDIAEMTKGRGCDNILLTNGTRITDTKIACRIGGLFSLVKLSLDSLDERVSAKLRAPGVRDRVQTAFDLLKACGANVQILATVTSLNQQDLDTFAKHFDGQVCFQPFYSMGRGRQHQPLSLTGAEYYDALTRTDIFRLLPGFHRNIHGYRNRPFKRCAMAKEEISINANGDVYPCHMLHYDEFMCGTIGSARFKDIYRDSRVLNELRQFNVDSIEQCSECVFRNICGGACRARVDALTNGVTGTNEFCDFEKRAILDALLYSFG